jgi:TPR repeat protein
MHASLVPDATNLLLGRGVPQDTSQALVLLRRACDLKLPFAFGVLGDC